MISEAELIVDRRRLKRRVTFWRILAVLLGIATVAALAWSQGWTGGDQIARVRIDGLITGEQKTMDLLKRVEEEDRVKAVILRIDSPGGTTAGSEAVYDAVRKISARKPVVAVMDTVAASGGYITALAADRIVARGNTITGSIGVIFSMPEFSKLLATVGITMEELKSGDLKAEPSPYKPMSDKARAASMELVNDGFAWFKGLVAERRQLPMATVDVLSDGRVYTGQQWQDLHKSHTKDVLVHWPDGHQTKGIEKHIEDLKYMWTFAPDNRIKEHPVRFGTADGKWTAVTGWLEGTFTKPMVLPDGKVIQPTGKAYRIPMATIGHWNKDGIMFEEYLFWDNGEFMKQIGLSQ